MTPSKISQSKIKAASPSQKFVEVQEIKDDVVILKNGGLRQFASPRLFNFELKSSDEQEALVGRFQGFLNSLDFPLQILISSRKLNIDPYLEDLKELARTQQNELLHAQTIEYIDFIEKFVELTDIMNKSFYLTVPYNPAGGRKEKPWDKIKFILKPQETIQKISPEKFLEYKDQLFQRMNHVINGLNQVEIKVGLLNTNQLIRLFYEFYNP